MILLMNVSLILIGRKCSQFIDRNTMWNQFITIVEEVIDKMVPAKILKERNYPKWMTRRAKLARKLKSTMWTRFRLSKEYTDWVE